MAVLAERSSRRPKGFITGLNLGANKTSDDRADDFNKVLAHCYVDFATVNVSSPNTKNCVICKEKMLLVCFWLA